MRIEWDRVATLAVSLGAAVPPGLEGYRLWKRRRYLAVAGIAVVILLVLGAPFVLLFFGT